MRRTPTPALGLVVLGGLAATAGAQPLAPLDPAGYTLPPPRAGGVPRDASGDLYGTTVTIHSSFGYGFLDSAPDVHIYGGTAFIGLNALNMTRSMHATSSQTLVAPHTYEFVIEWAMDDGGALIPAGAMLDGETITGIGFHVGEGSAPAQIIEWDPNPGFSIVSTGFELFDIGGTDLLGGLGEFSANDNGGAGVSGYAVVGGQDLALLGATVARATISVREVPAPAGIALLAAGGTILSRRRRSV